MILLFGAIGQFSLFLAVGHSTSWMAGTFAGVAYLMLFVAADHIYEEARG